MLLAYEWEVRDPPPDGLVSPVVRMSTPFS